MDSRRITEPASKEKIFMSPAIWAVISLFVMTFIMGLVKIYSPDLGFHLKSAEWMVNNRKLIYTDSFNYVAEGSKYYDMQWLFQLFIYSLYKIGGDSLLVIANSIAITCSLVLVWLRFMKNTTVAQPGWKLVLFAFTGLLCVQALTFEIRPHVLSWIFLNLILWCLESYKRGNKKALVFLPVIMVVWANTHSLSILGLATIAIYNTGLYLEEKKTDKRLLLFSGLSVAAFLITPYFIGGLLYAFSQFGLISGGSLLKSYVGELQSPFTSKEINLLGSSYFTSPLLIIHLAALLSVFSIVQSMRQKQFTDSLLLGAYLVILSLANKNYGYFLVVSLPLITKYLLNWLEQRRKRRQKPVANKKKNASKEVVMTKAATVPYRKLIKRIAAATVILSVFISITSITDSYPLFRHSPYRFGLTIDKDQLPVDATAFLNKNHVKGKLLNHLDFGGYLMAHYGEKVFIDGRMDVLPEDFFEKYYASITRKSGIKDLLAEYKPDIVIFPYVKASYWWDYLLRKGKEAGYRPVYFDGLSVVYLRSAAYPDLPGVNEQAALAGIDSTAVNRLNECIETEKTKGLATLFSGLWQRQSFSIADQNKAIYCFTNGFERAALSYSVIGVEKSTVQTPNIFKNLAIYYQDKRMYNIARLCADKSN